MSRCRAHSGTCDQIILPVVRFLCGALSDERTDLQFAVQSLNDPSCAELVTIHYCLIWDSPNQQGQVPVFISPRNRVAQLYEARWGYFTTDGQSVCLGIEHPCETCDQILLPIGMLLSEICGLVSVGHPLWREDGSTIYSVITQWFESRRTRNHTLLSYLRLPQPGGPGSRTYILQVQGGPVIPPGTEFLLLLLLRLTGLRWQYSNPPSHGIAPFVIPPTVIILSPLTRFLLILSLPFFRVIAFVN
jgi:hypothetical protein